MRLKIINRREERVFRGGGRQEVNRVSVINAETGEVVQGIRRLTLTADPENEYIPIATVEVEVDIDLEALGTVELRKVIA